ncbi:MAG: S8 family serine peptidase [Planctomycetota bacterium]
MVTRTEKRFGIGLAAMALTVGSLLLVDITGGLSAAKADAGTSLTEPIPPRDESVRPKSVKGWLGWKHAKARLQADMPTGRGIALGQVEGNPQSGYIGNTNDRTLPGTGFVPESGKSEKVSGHATEVAKHIAGPNGAGQGVRAIHAWAVNHWMGKGYLNADSNEDPRSDHPARVFNHSWIAPNAPNAPLILRRVDYAIDTNDILVVVGVDNKAGQIPDLLASAYNTISVGTPGSDSSDALTKTEGEGRSKPEIVAPGQLTSWTTGVVTGVCAALLEYADRLAEADAKNKDAAKSEVIKAVLFAGARRPDRWTQLEGEPLDRKLGAGVVEIDRSLVILDGGHVAPDQETDQRYGWSFATIDPGKVRTYAFTVDVAQGQAGIALVWHRRVRGGKANVVIRETGEQREIWNLSTFVPNLNLGLIRTDADGTETLIAASTSKVDNVELIHLPALEPGQYTLRIARQNDDTAMAWDYAVAWRIEAKTN